MPDIQNWDSGGNWDSGLQFDVNNFPSRGNIQPYLDLVVQQHADKPKFIGSLIELLQPVTDNIETLRDMPGAFDLDAAIGSQLDDVGRWVGRTRFLRVPLPNVYFSFDITGLGFDQGTWLGPFDPTTGLTALPDAAYRTYLKAVIAANQWDGSIPAAYAVWDALFQGTGYTIILQDNNDMTMYFGLVGGQPDAVTLALLTGGYLGLRPEGVRVRGYYVGTVPDSPLFGFDADNSTIGGFDSGSWATLLPPT